MKTSEEIRNEFLGFFEEKAHTIVPSGSLVPQNDPTLLFTNAGMNQFKDVFLGAGSRPYVRAADTQKCLRVSGKHNDLEEVGIDTYHHTFFEMLGNWSFGDYFKKEAVEWAWELLVDRWGLEPDRIYVTVHEGDEGLGLSADEEAAQLWKENTGVRDDHVLYFGSKDNFWMMGDTGPCGPCSEVHYDLRSDAERKKVSGAELVNADDPRVMEIWNLVFIQYNAKPDGSLEKLSARHVDTGMGFERIVAVLQGKRSNYDTDLFLPILNRIAELAPLDVVKDYAVENVADKDERERLRIAMRVIADHVRTIVFSIADGAAPSNTGAGYVIRRILRRAVRFGYETLGFREAFLYQLVPSVVERMGGAFPEIADAQDYIARMTHAEENSFLATLGHGITLFETIVPYVERAARGGADRVQTSVDLKQDRRALDILTTANLDPVSDDVVVDGFIRTASANQLPGEVAFLLHDTYGFPIDLTQLMARERGITVDMKGYNRCMDQQRARARAASHVGGPQEATQSADGGGNESASSEAGDWARVSEGDDSLFVGYDTLRVEDAHIRMTCARDDADGPVFEIVLDRTPFYAESGGQIGDTGTLTVAGETMQVLDTYRRDGHIVHRVDGLPSNLDKPVLAAVREDTRSETAKHHSATHLLHAALRERLGPHVGQKGSLVAPDRLRFDFSHFERVGDADLRAIEERVNQAIQTNIPRVEERDVPVDDALARGAMALFGEKYGDRVRMITFDPEYSVELCGGTHVAATGELGLFRFTSEGSVASGVRRVEAVVGKAALDAVRQMQISLDAVRGQFKALQRPVEEAVAEALARNTDLEKELAALRQASLATSLDSCGSLSRDARVGVRAKKGLSGGIAPGQGPRHSTQ